MAAPTDPHQNGALKPQRPTVKQITDMYTEALRPRVIKVAVKRPLLVFGVEHPSDTLNRWVDRFTMAGYAGHRTLWKYIVAGFCGAYCCWYWATRYTGKIPRTMQREWKEAEHEYSLRQNSNQKFISWFWKPGQPINIYKGNPETWPDQEEPDDSVTKAREMVMEEGFREYVAVKEAKIPLPFPEYKLQVQTIVQEFPDNAAVQRLGEITSDLTPEQYSRKHSSFNYLLDTLKNEDVRAAVGLHVNFLEKSKSLLSEQQLDQLKELGTNYQQQLNHAKQSGESKEAVNQITSQWREETEAIVTPEVLSVISPIKEKVNKAVSSLHEKGIYPEFALSLGSQTLAKSL